MSDDTPTWIDWARWPATAKPRRLYVCGLAPDVAMQLQAKGYEPVDVLSMPRDTAPEHQEALEAWMQGMVEGSILPDEERRKAIELEMRERGFLVHRTLRVDARLKLDKASVEELLNFGESRFTMNRATKEKIVEAKMAAMEPGVKAKH